jgi:hypothetical protein
LRKLLDKINNSISFVNLVPPTGNVRHTHVLPP